MTSHSQTPYRRLTLLALSAGLLLGTTVPRASAQTASPDGAAAPGNSPQDEAVAPNVKAAVERALAFCKAHQKPDGSFEGTQAMVAQTAVPSLVVMAFLAHGDVPGQGPNGDVLNKAIDFVLNNQQPDGLFAVNRADHVMYEHGISTVMLSEVYGMVDDNRRSRIDKALAKSVALILAAQKVPKSQPIYDGGWRYTPNSPDSDISCTGWQLMALRGAANCGAAVPPQAIADGLEYVRRSAIADGGFVYMPKAGGDQGQANQPRSGTGIVAMELLGKHNSPEAIAAGNWLLAHPPDRPNFAFYYYGVYYCAQAVNQLGGKYWDDIYPKLVTGLLAQQRRDGSFGPANDGNEAQAGPCYTSAMACLALCVPYRYLPLYQK